MSEELERFKGTVKTISKLEVVLIITEVNGKESDSAMRSFPKNLFEKDVKEGDEYNFIVTSGSGWMQIDLKKVQPPFVMVDDDDSISDEQIKQLQKQINDDYADYCFVEQCRKFAIEQHNRVNQKYGDKPYVFHLKDVVFYIMMFIHLVPKKYRANVIGAGWNHDTIEDTGITWNDLKKATNEMVANIVYALTNEKGKSRKERANAKYYRGIRNEMFADLAKFADRLANIKRSLEKHKLNPTKGGMFLKYKSEHPNFVWSIIKPEWYELSEQIIRLFMGHNRYLKHRKETHELRDMIKLMDEMLNQE